MQLTSLPSAEAMTDLKYSLIASSKKPLHMHLRRSREEPTIYTEGFYIAFWSDHWHK
jgi:hypothetical protein